MGAWLEQLLAESTGKQGKGFIPIDGEILSGPGILRGRPGFRSSSSVGRRRLRHAAAGSAGARPPCPALAIEDTYQIAQLFIVWEMAVAVAGAVLSINPFDQPDVERASSARVN